MSQLTFLEMYMLSMKNILNAVNSSWINTYFTTLSALVSITEKYMGCFGTVVK